jgi:EmrB/QacA subfamily drug resistance transporter
MRSRQQQAQTSTAGRAALRLACLGVFVVILDATIVSVALPDIGAELGFAPTTLAWVVNAYTLAFAGALLLAGRLVSNHGTRSTFLAGIGCFGAASLACGLAPAPWLLVAPRAVQGLGGALVVPATLTLVTDAHPQPGQRARALGLWSAVGAAGAAAGTVAGGLLTQAGGWRWVFLVNVPIAAGSLVTAARLLPRRPGGRRHEPLDVPGAVLATAGLTALIYGVLTSSSAGWTSARVLAPLAGSTVVLGLFTGYQRRWARAPLVPAHLFRRRGVVTANATIFCLGFGFFASPVLLSIYLQEALGYSPLRAGLAFLPAAAALFTGAQAAGRLTHRYGVRTTAASGALAAVGGFGWLTQLGAHTGYWPTIALGQVLFGLGIGTAFTPITVAATAVPRPLAGVAAGVLNTVRQVAAALGLAVLSALALSPGPVRPAGFSTAFLAATCACALAAVGCATALPPAGLPLASEED